MTDILNDTMLWPQRRTRAYTRERENYLRANPELSVSILAFEMNLTERFIIDFQRKLGLRRCANTPRMGDEGWRSRAKH